MPAMTPAPTPAPTITPLPPPISRPPDARGIAQLTPPFTPVIPPYLPPPAVLWPAEILSSAVPCVMRGKLTFIDVIADGLFGTFAIDFDSPKTRVDSSLVLRGPTGIGTLQIGHVRFSDVIATMARATELPLTAEGTRVRGVIGTDLIGSFAIVVQSKPCQVILNRQSLPARTNAGQSART
jgi:hypothetical protein